jgi:hypothetical protein
VNNGRGLAEGVFLNAEVKGLPERATAYWHADEMWHTWTETHRLTMVSKAFPPLPPGSGRRVLNIDLRVLDPTHDDVIIAITCGSRNGAGTAKTIVLPSEVLAPIVEFFNGRTVSTNQHAEAVQRFVDIAKTWGA